MIRILQDKIYCTSYYTSVKSIELALPCFAILDPFYFWGPRIWSQSHMSHT